MSDRRLSMPSARAPRRFAWLSVFVLLMLVAAAGTPDGRTTPATTPPIAAVEAAVLHPACANREAVPGAVRQAIADVRSPRPLPRTRRVATRGLPPPRAPSA